MKRFVIEKRNLCYSNKLCKDLFLASLSDCIADEERILIFMQYTHSLGNRTTTVRALDKKE